MYIVGFRQKLGNQCCGSGSGPLDPGSRVEQIQRQYPGSGMNILDLIFENLLSVFWLKILKFFDALDPGWKKRIPDKHPGSAALVASSVVIRINTLFFMIKTENIAFCGKK